MKLIYHVLAFVMVFSLSSQFALANNKAESELATAERIVKAFLSYDDNVDDFENYWLVAKAVANIDPVDTRRKVQFLIDVCKGYTPTDKSAATRLACDKIWFLGKKLAPNAKPKELHSKNSPLFKAITK